MTEKVEGLRASEIESCKFAFNIYECDTNKLDGSVLNRVCYALNMNPSLERLAAFGATQKPGEKFFTCEEVLKIYASLKKDVKDMGCYEDFIELLKLSDKLENGWMPLGELSNFLLALGEKLTDVQVDEVFEEHMGEEDDDGNIEYVPFLAGICEVKKEK